MRYTSASSAWSAVGGKGIQARIIGDAAQNSAGVYAGYPCLAASPTGSLYVFMLEGSMDAQGRGSCFTWDGSAWARVGAPGFTPSTPL